MDKRAFPKLRCVIRPLCVAAGLAALGTASSLGQTGGAAIAPALPSAVDTPYVATMTFDVASVRENKDVDLRSGVTMSGQLAPDKATLRLTNWDIENLISFAYEVDRFQIVGDPQWPFPTVFVIEAKSDSEADARLATLTKKQQRAEQMHMHMMQTLLEQRFKLKTHTETKESDIFNLVVAKGGPKLAPEGSAPPSPDESKRFGEHPVPALYQKNDGQGYDYIAHACSMDQIAKMLTSQFGRPVIDRTGLTGKYDFVLKYKGRWDRDRSADDLDPMPPMDRALQEELGLKVEAAKGPRTVLVIDHIEKPSEN